MEPILQVQGINPQETAPPVNPPIANSATNPLPSPVPVAPSVSTSSPPTPPVASPVSNTPATLPEKPKRNLKPLVFILIGIGILGAGAYFVSRAPGEELTGKISFDRVAEMPKAEEEGLQGPAVPPPPIPKAPDKAKGPKVDLPEINIDAVRELPPQQGTPGAPQPAREPEAPKGGDGEDFDVGLARDLAKPDLDAAVDALRGAQEDKEKDKAPSPGKADLERAQVGQVLDAIEKAGGADRLLAAVDDAQGPKQPEPIRQPEPPKAPERELPKIERDNIEPLNQPDSKLPDAMKTREEQEAEEEIEAARLKAKQKDKLKAEQEAREKAEQEARIKAEEEARKKAEDENKAKEDVEKQRKADEEAAIRLKTELEAKKKEAAEAEKARLKAEEDKKKAEDEAKKKAAEEKRKKEEAELLAAIMAEDDDEEEKSGSVSAADMERQLATLKQQLAAALRDQSAANSLQIAGLQAEIVALNKQIANAASGGVTVVVPQTGGAAGTVCADPSFTYDPVRKVCIPPTAVTVIPEKEKAKEISIVTKKDKKIASLDTAASGEENETETSAVTAAAAKAKAAAAAKASGVSQAAAKTGAAKVVGAKSAGVSSGAASAAKKLHGAAIQGETGPGILLYPLLVASANGIYYALQKRRKSLK